MFHSLIRSEYGQEIQRRILSYVTTCSRQCSQVSYRSRKTHSGSYTLCRCLLSLTSIGSIVSAKRSDPTVLRGAIDQNAGNSTIRYGLNSSEFFLT